MVTLRIPPLKERSDDIPLLFVHLAREARARYRREMPDFTPELEAELLAHGWPGNVRELRNVADRFVLGLWRAPGAAATPVVEDNGAGADLATRLARFEKGVIEAELKRHNGRMRETYEALGLSRKGLYDKIRRLGIETEMPGDDG